MQSLSSLNSRIDGSRKFNKIKYQNSENIGDIMIAYFNRPHYNVNSPPKATTIHYQNRKLRK